MGAKKRKTDRSGKTVPEKLTEAVAKLSEADDSAVSRVRKVAEALELERVAGFLESSEDIMSAVRELLHRGGGRYTLEEAASKAGISAEQFARLNLAIGFADPGPAARVFTDEDIEVLQLFEATKQFFGEDIAMQNARVMGSAMARVADAFISSFAVTVGRQSSEGDFGPEDLQKANETAIALLPSAVRAMDVLLRRHLELKSRTDSDFLGPSEWAGVDTIDRAIGFCDLIGSTALAERKSAKAFAAILREFETTASDLITSRGASVVKLIGDEVMFVAPDVKTAAEVALSLAEAFEEMKAVPSVRCGLAAGRVIVLEGDYHGPVVNLAARIVKQAPPGGVVAPQSLVSELGNFSFADAGTYELKGFEEPVDLVQITR